MRPGFSGQCPSGIMSTALLCLMPACRCPVVPTTPVPATADRLPQRQALPQPRLLQHSQSAPSSTTTAAASAAAASAAAPSAVSLMHSLRQPMGPQALAVLPRGPPRQGLLNPADLGAASQGGGVGEGSTGTTSGVIRWGPTLCSRTPFAYVCVRLQSLAQPLLSTALAPDALLSCKVPAAEPQAAACMRLERSDGAGLFRRCPCPGCRPPQPPPPPAPVATPLTFSCDFEGGNFAEARCLVEGQVGCVCPPGLQHRPCCLGQTPLRDIARRTKLFVHSQLTDTRTAPLDLPDHEADLHLGSPPKVPAAGMALSLPLAWLACHAHRPSAHVFQLPASAWLATLVCRQRLAAALLCIHQNCTVPGWQPHLVDSRSLLSSAPMLPWGKQTGTCTWASGLLVLSAPGSADSARPRRAGV